MRGREISALAVIVCILGLAVEGFAIERPVVKKTTISREVMRRYERVRKVRGGPCGWFNREGCPEREQRRERAGCTAERMDTIDSRRAGYPHRHYLGEPTSGYHEIDQGCKRDFEGGTIYVTYTGNISKVVAGPIRDLYLSLGECSSELGWPRSFRAESPHKDTPYEIGLLPGAELAAVGYDLAALEHRHQFANGWVYWDPSQDTPRVVMDRVHDTFQAEGGTPELGFPRNDTGMDSHAGEVLFQAFDEALIFENVRGEMEIFRDGMLDAYLEGASEYRHYLDPIHDPLEAETELGLPTSDYLPTPNGSVRVLHRGTIYYRDGAVLQVFPKFIAMLDGRVVHSEAIDADPWRIEISNAIREDPYLADYRKDVVSRAMSFVGLCGDEARVAIGTTATEYCSEFVRQVYRGVGVSSYLWGGGIFLWSVTYASQLRWIFEHNSRFVYAGDADTTTAEPGDYLSMYDEGHSALVVATSIDGRRLWKVGGNEGRGDCVNFSEKSYFDERGVINDDFYGFGKLDASFF